jgi:hypothetical protein
MLNVTIKSTIIKFKPPAPETTLNYSAFSGVLLGEVEEDGEAVAAFESHNYADQFLRFHIEDYAGDFGAYVLSSKKLIL